MVNNVNIFSVYWFWETHAQITVYDLQLILNNNNNNKKQYFSWLSIV